MRACVLVIDDAPAMVELLRDVLTDEGFDVVGSATLPDLATIVRLRPDLIILDYLFGPEPSGWLLARQLRSEPATAEVPMIICTAADIAPDLAQAFRAQQIDLVRKPFDVDDLVQRVMLHVRPDGARVDVSACRVSRAQWSPVGGKPAG